MTPLFYSVMAKFAMHNRAKYTMRISCFQGRVLSEGVQNGEEARPMKKLLETARYAVSSSFFMGRASSPFCTPSDNTRP